MLRVDIEDKVILKLVNEEGTIFTCSWCSRDAFRDHTDKEVFWHAVLSAVTFRPTMKLRLDP